MDAREKRSLSERDICTKFITPAIKRAGWDVLTQMREEVTFTDGRVIVRGQSTSRGSKKRTDYLLYFKPDIPLAVVEAKDTADTGPGDPDELLAELESIRTASRQTLDRLKSELAAALGAGGERSREGAKARS